MVLPVKSLHLRRMTLGSNILKVSPNLRFSPEFPQATQIKSTNDVLYQLSYCGPAGKIVFFTTGMQGQGEYILAGIWA